MYVEQTIVEQKKSIFRVRLRPYIYTGLLIYSTLPWLGHDRQRDFVARYELDDYDPFGVANE